MKLKELKKMYVYSAKKKTFTIDVQLEDYRDAYSDWDFSPYINRDLDEGLTQYLLECSKEIPSKYHLIVQFHIISKSRSDSREEKSIIGMHNYFKYQLRKLKNKKIQVAMDVVKFLCMGSILLLAGFYLDEFFKESLLLSVLSEGFFVGGWVMLWEMFSTWFFDLTKLRNTHKHFKRLNDSTLIFSD